MSEQANVEYRQLGNSGLRVSVPIIGGMSFGSSKWLGSWVLDEDDALPLLKAAWDRGINTIDTANVYSNGESERIIGKFIEKYNIPRHLLIIATKCSGIVGAEVGMPTFIMPQLYSQRDYVNQSGLSRAAIFNAVNASLERLNTSYIDLLQIHRFDPQTPVEETMRALHDLVACGKVRYIGASSMRCWQFAYMNEVASRNGWTKFVSMQDEHSLLYREEEREMIPYCKFNGIGIIPWGPLCDGHLARPLGTETLRKELTKGSILERKHRPSDEMIISRVEEIAKKKGWKMSQVALVWSSMKITSPIVGINSISRLHDSILPGLTLSEEEIAYLEQPYDPRDIRAHA